MASIDFEHVTKRYADGVEAVKDMNLAIADGELMVLVGPSGSGKSTALRMVAGLEDISDGVLKVGGEVVNDRSPRDRDIAMVFQNYALYPHMTVRENMGFAETQAALGGCRFRERVIADIEGGRRAGVHATPTFFVDGARLDRPWQPRADCAGEARSGLAVSRDPVMGAS